MSRTACSPRWRGRWSTCAAMPCPVGAGSRRRPAVDDLVLSMTTCGATDSAALSSVMRHAPLSAALRILDQLGHANAEDRRLALLEIPYRVERLAAVERVLGRDLQDFVVAEVEDDPIFLELVVRGLVLLRLLMSPRRAAATTLPALKRAVIFPHDVAVDDALALADHFAQGRKVVDVLGLVLGGPSVSSRETAGLEKPIFSASRRSPSWSEGGARR
jgi:hypothetical protein